MEPQSPYNRPESVKEQAARIGCIVMIAVLVVAAAFLGFLFTQGIR